MTEQREMRRGGPVSSLLRPGMAPVLAVFTGLVACALAVRWTGAADPLVFVEDAGPLVRWSAPLVRVLHDVAAAVTVGALVFAAFLLPGGAVGAPEGVAGPAVRRASGQRSVVPTATATAPGPAPSSAMRLAVVAGFGWAVTALVGVLLSFADAAGLPLSSPVLPQQLGALWWEIDSTRIGALSAACAVVVASVAAVARRRSTAAWLAAVAVVGIVILGLASHTGTSDDHETSVNAMGLHVLGATVWVGGLVTLVVLHRGIGALAVVARRYSSVALWSFVTVGVSGVIAATTRLGSWSDLGTSYGVLLLVKVVAFVGLGVAGAWHRQSTIADLVVGIRGRPFLRLATGEIAVMGATFGVAAALSRSAPPEPEDFPDPTPALQVTGFPAPPEPSLASLWTTWRLDWLFLAVALVAIGTYAAGLLNAPVLAARSLVAAHEDTLEALRPQRGRKRPSLREARFGDEAGTGAPAGQDPGTRPVDRGRVDGDRWPAWRTACWVVGWLLVVWVTSGAIGTYARVSLSWHAALQLVLALVAGPLLALGDPVGVARRGIRPRTDGTLGAREVVTAVAASRVLHALLNPVAATTLLLGGLVVLHATRLLDLVLTTHPGHLLMVALTIVIGVLWGAATTRSPRAAAGSARATPVVVLGCLLAVVVAAFVAALLGSSSTGLLAGDTLRSMAVPWLTDLAADQSRAGAVALLVAVPVCVVLAVPHLVALVREGRGGSAPRR